jgi:hypothetical protein
MSEAPSALEGSPAFEAAAQDLERRTTMSRLEARGTLRLALKEAGLLPKTVAARPMLAVLEKILPGMLALRRVKDAPEVCRALAALVRALPEGEPLDADTPEKVFARIGGPASERRPRSGPRT